MGYSPWARRVGLHFHFRFIVRAFQVSLGVKIPPANAGDAGEAALIPGLGRSLGGGHGNPLQDSCLENAMDRGTWRAAVHGVTKESNTTGHFTLHSIHITDDNLLS